MSDGDPLLGRLLPAGDYLTLTAAFRRAVRMAGGGRAAAQATGRHESQISRWASPHEVAMAPLDAVADLEAEAGDPVVARELARLSGHALFPLPSSVADGPWARDLARLIAESNDVLQRLADGLAGRTSAGVAGDLTAAEIRELGLIAEIDEAVDALMAARAHAQATLESEPEAGR